MSEILTLELLNERAEKTRLAVSLAARAGLILTDAVEAGEERIRELEGEVAELKAVNS